MSAREETLAIKRQMELADAIMQDEGEILRVLAS